MKDQSDNLDKTVRDLVGDESFSIEYGGVCQKCNETKVLIINGVEQKYCSFCSKEDTRELERRYIRLKMELNGVRSSIKDLNDQYIKITEGDVDKKSDVIMSSPESIKNRIEKLKEIELGLIKKIKELNFSGMVEEDLIPSS